MKLHSLFAITALFAVATPTLVQAEVLELTTMAGKTYHQCRIVKIEPDGVMFHHANGAGKVLFKEMTKPCREHFGYDAEKAKAHEEKVATEKKKAREIAMEQAKEQAKQRQEAYARQYEARVLSQLGTSLNQGGGTNGWVTIPGTVQWDSYNQGYDRRYQYQGGHRGYVTTGSQHGVYGSLPYGQVGSFSTGSNARCGSSYTPRSFFAVPGVGINAAPQGNCAPVQRGSQTFAPMKR